MQFRIQDTGIGMNEEEQSKIFDLFFRGNDERINSSGIGLNLTKELVEIHHGKIMLQSKKNAGSVFTLTFPLNADAYSEEEKAGAAIYHDGLKHLEQLYTSDLFPDHATTAGSLENTLPQPTNKATLLIIEDSSDLVQLLKSQLENEYEIITAENGKMGLNKAFDMIPDLILCDIMLPEIDGLTASNQLKKDIRTSHIPIILLTGKASEAQQMEGLKSKANAYIAKPFNIPVLKQTIETLLYNCKRVKEHFTSIGYTFAGKDEGHSQMAAMGTPLTKNAPNKKSDRRFTSEFISIVENNLNDEDFSVETICREMNISKVQLYRKVKTLLNVNVNEYILNARIQKAKYYLQNEDLSISDIAFKTGFSTAAYFSTVFKAKTGTTPKEFKKGIAG